MAREHDTPASPTPSTSEDTDWAGEQADKIVDLVDRIKNATTDKAIITLRAIVFGLVIFVLVLASIVLLIVTSVRVADAYLPIGDGVGDASWAAHLFVGGLVTILGLGAWGSRRGEGMPPKPLVLALVFDVAIVLAVVFYGVLRAVT